MSSSPTALFNRPDTLFGVCEGVGCEFGFHPNFLRLGLAVMLLWNPVVVIGSYVALGVGVYLARFIAPVRPARREGANLVAVEGTAKADNEDTAVSIAA